MEFRPDLPFAEGLALDLWLPGGPVRACVAYLHGGGFARGSRKEGTAAALAARLVPEGVAVAALTCRLGAGPEALPPWMRTGLARLGARSRAAGMGLAPRLTGPALAAAVLDLSAAVAALRTGAVAPVLAGAPVRLVGLSAGGIAALALAAPPAGWSAHLVRPDAVTALAAVPPFPWRLSPAMPPCLILAARGDRIVPLPAARRAARRAAAVGAPLHLEVVAERGHAGPLAALLAGQDAAGRPWTDRLLS